MFSDISLARMRNWFLKGGAAILDQGLFSGGTFALHILLARWLDPQNYGAFSIAFTGYLFLSGFCNALILEPMSIFGASKYFRSLKPYLFAQIAIHISLSVLLGGITFIAGILLFRIQFISKVLSEGFVGMGIFLPLILSIWVARRACYTLEKPLWAFIGSSFYLITLLVGVWLVRGNSENSDLVLWFGILGMASLVGSCIVFGLIWMRYSSSLTSRISHRDLVSEQWNFGWRVMLASVLYFLGAQIQIVFVASLLDLSSAAAFRSLQILILPVLQIFSAMIATVFPSIAYSYGRAEYAIMRRRTFRFMLVVLAVSVLYEVALILGSDWIVTSVYGGKYAAQIWLIPVIGVVPVLNSLSAGISLILRSLQRPSFYLVDKVVVAIAGLASGYFFIRSWDVLGAVMSLIFVELVGLATYVWLYRNWFTPLITAVHKPVHTEYSP